jgi:dTDP-4-dehydrorhamnose reductase
VRVVVLGADGLIGGACAERLGAYGHEVVGAFGRAACDICDAATVRRLVASLAPDVVVNAAALTSPDRAEEEPDLAFRVNALGPEIVARACHALGARLVHFSTDFVFDGELGRPYDEFDEPRPPGLYGRSKLAGERLAAAACARTFVVRVAGVYGRGGRNFPSTILRRLRAGETLRADVDRRSSPTWVGSLVGLLARLMAMEAHGLYHVTARGETSWATFAASIAAALGLPPGRVEAVRLADLPLAAPRPRRAILENRMVRLRGLEPLPPWERQLSAYLQEEGVA